MIVALHQPASVVVSQLSKLHGHSYNGICHCYTFVVMYLAAYNILVNRTTEVIIIYELTKCIKYFLK